MLAQQVFRVSRGPAVTMAVLLLAIGGLGVASLRDPGLLVSPPLSVAAIVVGFGAALLVLPAALLPNRIEIGAAGVTVVVSGRRARFWWPEIVAMGEVTRRRRRAVVAVPRGSLQPDRRGPVSFDEDLGGWVLVDPRSLRADPADLAAAVNTYAPGVWRGARRQTR